MYQPAELEIHVGHKAGPARLTALTLTQPSLPFAGNTWRWPVAETRLHPAGMHQRAGEGQQLPRPHRSPPDPPAFPGQAAAIPCQLYWREDVSSDQSVLRVYNSYSFIAFIALSAYRPKGKHQERILLFCLYLCHLNSISIHYLPVIPFQSAGKTDPKTSGAAQKLNTSPCNCLQVHNAALAGLGGLLLGTAELTGSSLPLQRVEGNTFHLWREEPVIFGGRGICAVHHAAVDVVRSVLPLRGQDGSRRRCCLISQ